MTSSKIRELELKMLESWETVPSWLIDMFHEDIEARYPIGFGHDDEIGWYAMMCGQGPFLAWSEREAK